MSNGYHIYVSKLKSWPSHILPLGPASGSSTCQLMTTSSCQLLRPKTFHLRCYIQTLSKYYWFHFKNIWNKCTDAHHLQTPLLPWCKPPSSLRLLWQLPNWPSCFCSFSPEFILNTAARMIHLKIMSLHCPKLAMSRHFVQSEKTKAG